MDAKNLAIVFGPTLIRNKNDDKVSMVIDMSDQCRIIESIINHVSAYWILIGPFFLLFHVTRSQLLVGRSSPDLLDSALLPRP